MVYLETDLDDIVFREVVNFFVTAFSMDAWGICFFLYSSTITRHIPASGIASMIPRTPPRDAPASMMINTRNGERSRALLMTFGTRTLFSTCCMMR